MCRWSKASRLSRVRQACEVSTGGRAACNCRLRILAQESVSSDPDVYFSSTCICEHRVYSFHKALSTTTATIQHYFMLRTILLQWFVFISPSACSNCWMRCRRVDGSVCNTWAVWSSFWLRWSFMVTVGLICCLRLLLASCTGRSGETDWGTDKQNGYQLSHSRFTAGLRGLLGGLCKNPFHPH